MNFTDKILNVIFPPKCISCGEVLHYSSEDIFCSRCRTKWEALKNERCRTCGQKIKDCYCGMRDNKDGLVDGEVHLVQYDKNVNNEVSNVLFSCKDKTVLAYFRGIAKELYTELYPRLPENDYIVAAVPRTKRAKNIKGHDQSVLTAKEFCKLSGFNYCDLIYNEGEQTQKLSSTQKAREENAASSYKIKPDKNKMLKGKTVILIDDVVTTGASTVRCAKLLKSKGAKKVYVMCIAKTIR